MSGTLNLYTKDSSLADVTGSVGLLCEFAPDSPGLRRAEHSYKPDELLGSPDDALTTSYSLVSKLLHNTPVVDGLPLLAVFEESLLEQCSYIVQALHLDRWISDRKFSCCHFVSHSLWFDRLRQVREINNSGYVLSADVPPFEANSWRRAIRKLWRTRPSLPELFRRVTPLWWRHLSAIPMRRHLADVPRGGLWFYSTAYNYTKIALEYENYLPGRLNYLVEDPATGGRPLRDLGRDCHLLYAWSRKAFIPSVSEMRSIGRRITEAIAATPISDAEAPVRTALLKGEWYRHFLARLLPLAVYNSRVLQSWREKVAPEMILVGNAAWERTLLLRENREPIPAIMLQHGIMHWVYSVADQPVDAFLLRGPFFQRVINERLRRKTVIGNSPALAVGGAGVDQARDSILFITTPYDVPALFHPEDLRDILRSLLRVSHSCRRRLVIRVHPVEKISTYQRTISELQRELGLHADVVYSQGAGVQAILARSCLAVLHFSTMFMDCLRHGIPIVSFGWHWFPYRREFAEEQVFNFALDLRSFESLVKQGLEGSLPYRKAALDEFMAPTEPHDISKLFSKMWDSRSSAKRESADSAVETRGC